MTGLTLVTWPDGSHDLLTPEAAELLSLYGQAEDEDQQLIEKAMAYAGKVKFPTDDELATMTVDEMRAWVESLGEVRS